MADANTDFFTVSVDPTYSVIYILKKAAITSSYGYKLDTAANTMTISVPYDDKDALMNSINAYPTNYATDVVKPNLWEQVKAVRSSLEVASVPTTFGTVSNDSDSKTKLTGVVQMAALAMLSEVITASMSSRPYNANNVVFSNDWTMDDNSILHLNAADALSIGVQVGQYVSKLYDNARVLRNQIDAANTISDCALINVNSGWPTSSTAS